MTDTSYVNTIHEGNNKARDLVKKHKVLVVGVSWAAGFAEIVADAKKAYPDTFVVEFDKLDNALDKLELQKSFRNITDHCVTPDIFVNGKDLGTSEEIFELQRAGKLSETIKKALV
ncbi:hypothetical protein B0I72DRAFT_134390 [Yarrowia lipolytica]|jgi:glutaredoxin-related protein|uniref:Uncharacterized protein n=1 Tax=Yarrowia lipolytica TaxID=4952 RepID=A0A371C521_YARLL|nr:hypothetical protein BKA91DRAFT_141454 [Yarrowia lipolytica]KAE8173385.1 hypothetical protein BKA90DRAFT_135631 [Yarrowia lipolytica]KAJ8056754.1 hypothetical protein LXG23DRAFT_33645 [Yarrowia lipolytica]QNP98896.1 Hypothetical protein YALI2_E00212g [Yarrowia lipolytica]RDW25262.1 hypothetical protein B0I71DRAFT_132927 [Yarrowia lipolytica]